MKTKIRAALSESTFALFAFRSEHQIVTVIIQMFLLFAGFVVIAGIVYVLILLIIILVHHVLFDRDPHSIPDYVKNSGQFSSDSEDEDSPDESPMDLDPRWTKSKSQGQVDDEKVNRAPSAQRKLKNLDRFINDLDTTRQNIQRSKHTKKAKRDN